MALYIAEIVTIVRHKKFHNSFYALFVMRAIPDLVYLLASFYCNRLPSIIGSLLYPIYSQLPTWFYAISLFFTGHTFQANNLVTIFILFNRLTAIIMPMKHEKHEVILAPVNWAPIIIITNIDDPKTKTMLYIYYTLIMDTGTVVLSSCLLLWASGTFRQQLLKDFGIRINNVQNIRVDAQEGPRNNNHWAMNVSHQLHTSSVQQIPA
ncbi:hypothetical protein GPALN_006016 [Globodera pallida]|nr:hypothetical protein GPALN_006016 [Globodera pallida]